MDDDFVLDEQIYYYINERFVPSMADEIIRSFEILIVMGKQFIESEFIELLIQPDRYESDTIQDTFLLKLRTNLQAVLIEHHLHIKEETPLFVINELLSGVMLLQTLDDYSQIASYLEAYQDPEETYADIFQYVTTLTTIQIQEAFERYSPYFLEALLAFIYEQEANQSQAPLTLNQKIIEKARLFAQFIDKHSALGIQLIKQNIPVGLPLETYLSYVNQALQENQDLAQKALDILSLLIISEEGYNLPLITYRKVSNQLLPDLKSISKVDSLIMHILNDFEKFQLEAQHEKD